MVSCQLVSVRDLHLELRLQADAVPIEIFRFATETHGPPWVPVAAGEASRARQASFRQIEHK